MTGRPVDGLDRERVERAVRPGWGQPLRVLPLVGSTQDEALSWAREGAPEGSLVVADRQTAGRGRRGRTWHSPAGRSLYASLLLRPRTGGAALGVLTTAAGLAIAEAIEGLYALRAELKWPNDVTVGGRKLAGILVETVVAEGRAEIASVGMGINVSWTQEEFPRDVAPRATSILLELERRGRGDLEPGRIALLAAVLERLEVHYRSVRDGAGKDVIRGAAARSAVLGRQVTVRLHGDKSCEGVATRLLESGALEIAARGRTHVVHAGEIERLLARG